MAARSLVAASITSIALASSAAAQCLDWAAGFGIPGLGLNEEVFRLRILDTGSGPSLYAAGKFNTAGGVAALGVARWTRAGWSPVGGGLGSVISGGGSAHDLEVFDPGSGLRLYGTGQFSLQGGAPGNYIAQWNGTRWGPVGSGLDNNASCLAVFDDGSGPALYVGGDFRHAGGVNANGIARWTGSAWQAVASSGPGPHTRHVMAYDSARQRVVIFGGMTQPGITNETWEFDGVTWEKRTVVAPPPPRIWTAMAYDSARARLVLFGGKSGTGGGAFNDTWEFDGVAWAQRTPAKTTPPARFAHAMAFDPVSGRTLMFGGESNTGTLFGQLWAWDGRDWTIAALTGPSARRYPAMVFDEARGQAMLFGGVDAVSPKGDTWLWDGESWAQAPAASPGTRFLHAMAYDSARQRIVMFGGGDGFGGGDANTWEWDGAAWSLTATTGPSARHEAPMAYHAASSRTVLCGGGNQPGLNDVWAWNGAAWTPIGGGFNRTPHTMFTYDDGSGPALYVGGAFGTTSGVVTGKIARWSGAGWAPAGNPLFGSEASAIKSFVVFDDGTGPALYAGGSVPIGPVGATVLRRTGATWTPVGNVSLGDVRALAVYDSGAGPQLYAVGAISAPATPPVVNVARWTGSQWVGVGTGTAGAPASAVVFPTGTGSRLWLGGKFTHAGGMPSVNIARWGEPCGPPSITQQPQSQTAAFNQSVMLQVEAVGTAPLTYAWRRGGIPLTNGGPISGVNTPTLQIGSWTLNHAGSYDVSITNALGEVVSEPAILTIPGAGPGGAVTVEPVVFPPHPVPGMAGHTFTDFSSPVQSTEGQAVFPGQISGPTFGGSALLLWQDEAVHVIQKQNDQAPGSPTGVVFQNFAHWIASAGGRASFDATLQGTGVGASNNFGIWHRDEIGTVRVIRKGLEAPGGSGNQFAGVGLNRANDAGHVLYAGCLNGAGTPSLTGCGLWLWSRAAGTNLVVLAGDPAPGVGAPFTAILSGTLNHAGSVAFIGWWGSPTKSGIWGGPPAAFTPFVKTGDPAAGNIPAGTLVAGPVTSRFLLNDVDQIVAAVNLELNGKPQGSALYTFGGTLVTPVVLPDDPAPGIPGMTIRNPAPHAFSDEGAVVFTADLVGDCGAPVCPSNGAWFAKDGTAHKIAVNRAAPPGSPPGFIFSNFDFNTVQVGLNNQDQVALQCVLEFGSQHYGIYGWTATAGFFPIALPGTQLETAPGQYRTVSGAFLSSYLGGSTGPTSTSLNDAGRLVFQVNFTDGTRGVFAGDFAEFAGGYYWCPAILTAPVPVSVFSGGAAEFSVQAVGAAGPLSYQWRRNGEALVNGGPISGANTATLLIDPVMTALAGSIDVVVTNTCGSVTSPAAPLAVRCYPDCNTDGTLTVADFGCFQNRFVQQDPYADCNASGTLTIADFACFQTKFVGGCP